MEFYNCHISQQAIDNANEVLKSGYLNQGKWVKLVEKDCKDIFGIENPVTVNSCTSALHIALELCNVRGREVVLPAKTFIATGIAVLQAGGIPIFVDINRNTGCPSFEHYEAKIGPDTAAAIGVSWGGSVTVCKSLRDVKARFDIPVIEDAAQAFGSIALDRPVIDFVCYSFQAIKTLTCGDGGLLSTPNVKLADKARAIRWFGVDKEKMTFSDIGERQFKLETLGYKYNMNDLNAAILHGNMSTLKERLKIRGDIVQEIEEVLTEDFCIDNGITIVSKAKSTHWFYPLLVRDRHHFIQHMRSFGVPATKTDTRIDKQPIFNRNTSLPNTDYYDSHEVNLPCHEGLSRADTKTIKKALQSYDSNK